MKTVEFVSHRCIKGHMKDQLHQRDSMDSSNYHYMCSIWQTLWSVENEQSLQCGCSVKSLFIINLL